MVRTQVVWSRSERAMVKDLVEKDGEKVTRTEKYSNFPKRWIIYYEDNKKAQDS